MQRFLLNYLWDDLFDAPVANFLPNLSKIHLPLIVLILLTQSFDFIADLIFIETQFSGLFIQHFIELSFDCALEETEKVV